MSTLTARAAQPAPALLVLAAFVALGLPDGMIGVAWPPMRRTFDEPLAALGLLNAVLTGGYMLATVANGALDRRLGTGRHLLLAGGSSVAGVLLYAAAPGFTAVLAGSAVLGFGAGALDAALNAYVALRHDPRLMNLMHAAYGVGTTIGPLAMTAAVAAASWRAAYAGLLVAQLVLVSGYWATRDRWPAASERAHHAVRTVGAGVVIAASLAFFFVYTGLEVAAGQWAFTLLTEDRGLSATAAGIWVGVYWGSIALGRLAAGIAGPRASPALLLNAGAVLAVAGAALLWWDPGGAGTIGLALLGLALAPIFPALVTLTPIRLGPARATAVIGYQFAAATLGAATVSGLAGVVAQTAGVDTLPLVFTAAAVVQLGLHAFLRARTRRT